jgi:hypothetical protein
MGEGDNLMLPPWLIEKTRENKRHRDTGGTPLQIPVPPPPVENRSSHPKEEKDENGVVVVDFTL